jgi:hypothetical protein
MAKKSPAATQDRITRDDLEAKFRGLQEGVQGSVEDKKRTILTVAAASGVFLLVVFFLLGRRSGNKKKTVVEIRRL